MNMNGPESNIIASETPPSDRTKSWMVVDNHKLVGLKKFKNGKWEWADDEWHDTTIDRSKN